MHFPQTIISPIACAVVELYSDCLNPGRHEMAVPCSIIMLSACCVTVCLAACHWCVPSLSSVVPECRRSHHATGSASWLSAGGTASWQPSLQCSHASTFLRVSALDWLGATYRSRAWRRNCDGEWILCYQPECDSTIAWAAAQGHVWTSMLNT